MKIITSEDNRPAPPNFGTRFQQGLDAFIGTVAPRTQLARMEARARINAQLHQYAGADTGRNRNPPNPLRSPDSPLAQSDALAMQRRAQDQSRDNAFIGHLAKQYRIYGLGDIQYIPNTGSKKINQVYRDFWCEWMKNADVQGRFHFIDMMQLALSGTIYNGRHGLIHHHNEDGTFQIQSVMGYNIGNPRAIYTNQQNVSGMVLDAAGRVVAYDLYRLGINGTVHFVQRVPSVIFSILNPVDSTDEYAAKTPLHAVLNDAHDMRLVENAWMKKIQWAAYKTAIFNTPNGAAPDPNENDLDGPAGSLANGRIQHQLPGEELHGEEGFNVEMLRNENPTNNESEFLLTKLAQIAMSLNLPLPFVWVMMGLPGTYTRLISEQAKRTFQHGPLGQKWLERSAFNEIKKMALLSGIVRGEIPHEDAWNKGEFMYPAHPTVDAGNDSAARLSENRQGITSMAEIASAKGRHWEDIDEELAAEALNKMLKASETSQNFNRLTGEKTTWHDAIGYIQAMSPNPPPPAKAAPDAGEAGEKPAVKGATPPQEGTPPADEGESKFTRLEAKLDKLVARFVEGWDESKHDRAGDGKFAPESGSGSGGSSKKKDSPPAANSTGKAGKAPASQEPDHPKDMNVRQLRSYAKTNMGHSLAKIKDENILRGTVSRYHDLCQAMGVPVEKASKLAAERKAKAAEKVAKDALALGIQHNSVKLHMELDSYYVDKYNAASEAKDRDKQLMFYKLAKSNREQGHKKAVEMNKALAGASSAALASAVKASGQKPKKTKAQNWLLLQPFGHDVGLEIDPQFHRNPADRE